MSPWLLSTVLLAATPDASGIPWIRDDWSQALAKAKAEKKAVAVDVWATWCHTCISMQTTILNQPELARVKDDLVWVALDYDLPKNSAFFEQYPVGAFPTFMVIDPSSGAVNGRWMGSGTPAEMAAFFGASAKGGIKALEASQRALAKQDYAEALRLCEVALGSGVGGGPRSPAEQALHTRLLLGWVEALGHVNPNQCAAQGVKRFSELDQSAQGLDFVAMVADCASGLPPGEQRPIMTAVKEHLTRALADPQLVVSADDRSGAYATLTDAQQALGDQAGVRQSQLARLAVLEAAAKAAKTPIERATYDDHRNQLYGALGRYADAEKMLEASERDLPKDFNPPWRLANVYLKQGKTDLGLKAIERALKLGYGGRKLRLYTTKIDLLLAAKRTADAEATLAAARAELKKLPASVVRPSWIEELEGRGKKIEAERAAPKG